MATIKTAIELQDNFSSVLYSVISAVNLGLSAMEDFQRTMNAPVDTASLEGAREAANQAAAAMQQLDEATQGMKNPVLGTPIVPQNLAAQPTATETTVIPESVAPVVLPVQPDVPDPLVEQPAPVSVPVEPDVSDPPVDTLPPVEVPIHWQSDNLEVFTGTGIERFEHEVQSANNMLNTLNATQQQIAQAAAQTDIFSPTAVSDMNNMQSRLQAIQQRIAQIESNPLNMGTDIANTELEQLRAQLDQAVSEQENLNRAVDNMDVDAANQAYLRLSQTVGNTERYIRDNVDEQGRFTREIEHSANEANQLMQTIKGAVAAYTGIAGIRKALSFVQDCTELFNTQLNAENQLMVVLGNMLSEDYVSQFEIETMADTTAAIDEINAIQGSIDEVVVPVSAESKALKAEFDAITKKASAIQANGIYGDEAMIAGAAEFATYFSDINAITKMMDTLSDYAMGMSGGGVIDSTAMVEYATGLGKIMTGSYEAMTKKGFEFTDAQKAIIEGTATQEQIVATLGEEYADATDELQAAAAISQVIEESWGGLYETMSDTPEGKIIQLTNAWGDMKEVVGGQLYPYVLLFVDAITENWGTIETLVQGLATGLEYLLGILSWTAKGAIKFAQVVVDNWSWISPIIYGIAAALAVYGTYLAVTKGIELACAGAKQVLAIAEGIHAAAIWATTSATWAEVTAQAGLNAAMYACPIVWIIALIIALIALFYALVAAINKLTGTSYSATGLICGFFAGAAAFIGNLFVTLINFVIDIFAALWNFIAAFANFFGNVFNDPVGSIARLFFDLADTVLSLLQSLASAIDTIFGSNLAGAVQGWRDSLGGWVSSKFGEEIEFVQTINPENYHQKRFDVEGAYNIGYSAGEEFESKFNPSNLFGITDIPSPEDYANTYTGSGLSEIGSGVDDIADNTAAMADGLSASDEDLKLLREIAEREAINQFTTAEVKVDFTSNATVSSDMDIDGMADIFGEKLREALVSAAEGVHI